MNMKYILLLLLLIVGYKGNTQNTYNPANATASNKSYSPSQLVSTDFRSWYYIPAPFFVQRDYSSLAEVKRYLNLPQYRGGRFPIAVRIGGTLKADSTIVGGYVRIYCFKDSTDDASLVPYDDVWSVNGRKGDVISLLADTLKGYTVDTSAAPRNGYLLTFDSVLHKWKLTAPSGSYTAGTGIIIAGNVISADNTTALWNANQLRGRNITTGTPAVGNTITWSGTQWIYSGLNGLDTAYLSNDTLYLVNTFDTIPVVIKTLYNADDTLSSNRTVELDGKSLTITGISGSLDLQAGDAEITVSSTQNAINMVGGTDGKKSINWATTTTGINVADTQDSLGMQYVHDYSTNGLQNDRWIPDIGAVRQEISDSIAATTPTWPEVLAAGRTFNANDSIMMNGNTMTFRGNDLSGTTPILQIRSRHTTNGNRVLLRFPPPVPWTVGSRSAPNYDFSQVNTANGDGSYNYVVNRGFNINNAQGSGSAWYEGMESHFNPGGIPWKEWYMAYYNGIGEDIRPFEMYIQDIDSFGTTTGTAAFHATQFDIRTFKAETYHAVSANRATNEATMMLKSPKSEVGFNATTDPTGTTVNINSRTNGHTLAFGLWGNADFTSTTNVKGKSFWLASDYSGALNVGSNPHLSFSSGGGIKLGSHGSVMTAPSIVIGATSMTGLTTQRNIAIGLNCGRYETGDNNMLIGKFVGSNVTGSPNSAKMMIIGDSAAYNSGGGSLGTLGAGTFWLHNYSNNQPMFWGQFSPSGANRLGINMTAAPTYTLDVSGQIRQFFNGDLLHQRTTDANVLYGLSITNAGGAEKGSIKVNSSSGEVRIGATGTGGYFPTFYSNNVEVARFVSGGNFGLGVTVPTATLHIKAGTTAASTGPLKLTEGSNPTTPEDGLINYVSNNVTFTEGSTVYTLAKTLTNSASLNFPDTGPGATSDLTITVTGVVDGQAVSLGVPNAATIANGIYTAWVSGANTVTIRFANVQAIGNLNPDSGTFVVSVIVY